MTKRRIVLPTLVVGLTVLAFAFRQDVRAEESPAGGISQETLEDHECLVCHGFAENEDDAPFVDGGRFLTSTHKGLDCTDCHGDIEGYPHPQEPAPPEACGSCHDDVYEALKDSVHAQILGPEAEDSTTTHACSACHGIHDVFPAQDRRSHLFPLEVPRTCGGCHGSFPEDVAPRDLTADQLLGMRYADDTHGEGLLRSGLVNAPTCVSCHGGHEVRTSSDPAAAVHPNNVSKTCGTCHVGIYEQYSLSIHGLTPRGHSEDNRNLKEPATCTDCHKPHHIQKPDSHFKLQIIETCSGCHGDRGNTYRGTYHGRVAEIGFGGVASCDDCHTAHHILPTGNPASSVNPAHRVETCSRCHEGATQEFTRYWVHADVENRSEYPILYYAQTIMRSVIYVTWAIWGIHTLLWLYRALKDRKKIKAHLEPVSGRWYRRWPWSYRAIHFTLIISFLLLATTGLPLRFSEARWAGGIFSFLGGAENVRWLHRFGAVLTFIYAGVFLLMIAWRVVRGERGIFWGPNSLIPRFKDGQDMFANFRYFLKGGEPPRFDRWTYYEKFDFIAEVWGVLFIGITGLIMWFPMFFTSFLPGPVINLAHILHSYEALLATSFIFTMHFFNANLRPGKFPVDTMFVHGRISEEELRHERPEEYERMRREGRLESEALPPPIDRVADRARIIGITLLSIGILLLLLMFSTIL